MKQLFRDGAAYRDPHRNVQEIRVEELNEIYGGGSSKPDEESERRFIEWLSNQGERSDAYYQKIWTTSVFIAIIVFIVLIGIMFPLVSAALLFLAAAVIGLLVCKGLVEDENARAQLEEMLNPETLAGFRNGQWSAGHCSVDTQNPCCHCPAGNDRRRRTLYLERRGGPGNDCTYPCCTGSR